VAWRVAIYRLPAEPARHRVAVWRELRKVGAVSLQQATWAVPSGPEFDAALARAAELAERADGQALVLQVADDDSAAGALEQLFTDDREAEWAEFLSECAKFEAELDHEVAIEKFTVAELDEEEHSYERLRRWYRELRSRDVFGAPSAGPAEQRLKASGERLEEFAERVYAARERP
jgi:DNA-binding transcriptional regulator PaaX